MPRRVLWLAVVLTACAPGPAGAGGSTGSSTGQAEGEPTAVSTLEDGGPTTGSDDGVDSTGTGTVTCEPGATQCVGEDALELCATDGQSWEVETCAAGASCSEGACIGPCDLAVGSQGCDFIATRLLAPFNYETVDRVAVVNSDPRITASVQLYRIQPGTAEEQLVEDVQLGPGDLVEWTVDDDPGDPLSWFRIGGMYRVRSDLPVVASHFAPSQVGTSSESSLLIPTAMLGQTYVVLSYHPYGAQSSGLGLPSYFEVVVLSDDTTLEWTPPVPTEPVSLAIGPVLAGGTGSVPGLQTYDALRISASNAFDEIAPDDRDLSGTVITATAPIFVASGTRCSRVPFRTDPFAGFCDSLQEVLIPVEHWGREYVAAPPPERDNELQYWRVYAGTEGTTTFRTDPQVLTAENCPPPSTFDNGVCTLPQRGAWVEIVVDHGVGFVVRGQTESDRLMVVGYLQSRTISGEPPESATELGDPAMYQTVPTDHFAERFVVTTGVGFSVDYLQVVRRVGGATVFVDGVGAAPWTSLGEYEYTDIVATSAVTLLESTDPFSVTHFGYTDPNVFNPDCPDGTGVCSSSYAHPAGWTVPVPRR